MICNPTLLNIRICNPQNTMGRRGQVIFAPALALRGVL